MLMLLDLSNTNNDSKKPLATVSKLGGKTQLQIPKTVFDRCKIPEDGRTHNFFTKPGEVHEGQDVIICCYGDHTELSAHGTIQRAGASIADKWFVQTPVQPEK